MAAPNSTSTALSEVLASQDALLRAAAEAIPHSFAHCTHSLGALRQAVHLCITCGTERGVCASCSVACHTDHEQVELFPKRNFRCDCPTAAIKRPCSFLPPGATSHPPNVANAYNHNFRARFCRCDAKYDAMRERETMVQCIVCEDWFHESCLNLRSRPSSRPPSPVPDAPAMDDDDGHSLASSSSLPPPLLPGDRYDALICGPCAAAIPPVRKAAGTTGRGVMVVVRDGEGEPWKVLGEEEEEMQENGHVDIINDDSVQDAGEQPATGTKRPPSSPSPASPKKQRLSPSSTPSSSVCPLSGPYPALLPILAQYQHAALAKLQDSKDKEGTKDGGDGDWSAGRGDVFLAEGWRERWCRCAECLPHLEKHPYLLEEEDTYEPPEDPDSGLSLEELGMRALHRLPRERALDGIRAFNDMRDDLLVYLRPFADEGRVVDEAAVRAFFEARREQAGAGTSG